VADINGVPIYLVIECANRHDSAIATEHLDTFLIKTETKRSRETINSGIVNAVHYQCSPLLMQSIINLLNSIFCDVRYT